VVQGIAGRSVHGLRSACSHRTRIAFKSGSSGEKRRRAEIRSADSAIEDRASVFRLADLEVGRVLARRERTSLRVDEVEPDAKPAPMREEEEQQQP
jgi:hypothetical protein